MRKILKDIGAKRVGKEACEELRKHLEKVAIDLLKEAKNLSSHAKRRTVEIEDIKLAWKRLYGRK